VSDAFVKWGRASTSGATFMDRVNRFGAAGISLNHPAKGYAVLLDVDGDHVATTTAELASLIDRRIGATLTFEWWFTADSDLACSYAFVPGKREVQTFYLDGLSSTEVATTYDLLRDLFWDRPDPSDWLVVDATGRSADFDWDDYLEYGVGDPSAAPDLIILSNASFEGRPGLPKPSHLSTSGNGFLEITKGDWGRS
jgi:hypothetical protein